MKDRLRRVLRIAMLLVLVVLGIRALIPRRRFIGVQIRVPTATCSSELISEFVPVQFRLLPGGKVLFGHDVQSRGDAMHLLMRIRATRGGKILFFDADDSLSFQEGISVLNDVRAVLPDWRIFVMTPQTRGVCEELVRSRSVPAG